MAQTDFQRALDAYLASLSPAHPPRLLLHGCCAPCSSYVLEYLATYFDITLCFYNPNIASREEYEKRAEEERRLLAEMPLARPVSLMVPPWEHAVFLTTVRGAESAPEGGERCRRCFTLRLGEAAKAAKTGGFDCFATTLTISPLKNAEVLNTIGQEVANACGATWLPSDFKKKNGYRRSVELSAEYGLYRQDYCGCVFSKQEREASK